MTEGATLNLYWAGVVVLTIAIWIAWGTAT
jgi:hypothetical protein